MSIQDRLAIRTTKKWFCTSYSEKTGIQNSYLWFGEKELHQSQDTNVLRQLHQFTQACPDYKLWLGATYGGQNTVKTCVKMSLPLFMGGIGVTNPGAIFM